MPSYNCPKCEKEFTDKSKYVLHMARKFPCDMNTRECSVCDKEFSTASHLRRHMKQAHPAALHIEQHDNSTINTTINNINNNNNIVINITVAPPNEFGRETVDHLVNLPFSELKKLIGLAPNEETIASIVKSMHTRKDHPHNHNVLLESADAENAYVFKHKSWREQERDSLLNDCACDGAIKMLDIEHIYAEKLSGAALAALENYRDEVEGLARGASEGLRKPLYDAIARVLVEFTKTQPDLLRNAKVAAEVAAPPRSSLAKVFEEWKPGGVRYETCLKNIKD